MNKAFKVLWNHLRGSYVVASEATASHGKTSKAAKAVMAAVALGSLALSNTVSAEDITVDFDYVQNQGTTKFISGKGNTLVIKTDADAYKMIQDIKKAGGMGDLLVAISQVDGTNKTAILTGLTGGGSFYDAGFQQALNLAKSVGGVIDSKIPRYAETLVKQFVGLGFTEEPPETAKITQKLSGNTNILIGGDGSEPVLLATAGGDRVVNTGLAFDLGLNEVTTSVRTNEGLTIDLTREGSTNVKASSGNLFLLTGGSSAVNLKGLDFAAQKEVPLWGSTTVDVTVEASMTAESTSVTINGNVGVTLEGHTNAAGVLLAGSAIALGGTANSTVRDNAILNITSTDHPDHNLSGLTTGVFGGGLAASTLDGTSTSTVKGDTVINISGTGTGQDAAGSVVVGAFGSGAALSTELSGRVWSAIKGLTLGDMSLGDNIHPSDAAEDGNELNSTLLNNGGKATVNSRDIYVNATGNSVTVGLAGGGLAAAWSGAKSGTSESYVNTGDIVINLGDENTHVLTEYPGEKKTLQDVTGKLVSAFKDAIYSSSLLDGMFELIDDVTDAVKVSQTDLKGTHVGTVGGSVVIAGMPSTAEGTKAIASAESGNIQINLNGGYTVATLGGGMTIATAKAVASNGYALGTEATSHVDSTQINVLGGDNVLVMAGGAAYATGSTEDETTLTPERVGSDVKSESVVNKANINVGAYVDGEYKVGSVDGIFGGGLAVDDTGADDENAIATTTQVVINVNEGAKVNAADPSPLANMATGNGSGQPSNGSYVHDTAGLLAASLTKAAIVGGGIASGAGAKVFSDTVEINLNGGTVNGNIYAGGVATLGGKSEVGTATVNVNGATISGDIYAGGLVGSERNNNFGYSAYSEAQSTVGNVTIDLRSGEVQNVYLGGYTYEGSNGVTSTVETGKIVLSGKDVFKGTVLDGSGAAMSTLEISANDYQFAESQKVIAFDNIIASGKVTNVAYDFDDRTSTNVVGSIVEFKSLTNANGKTLSVGNAETGGAVAVNPFGADIAGLTLKVDNGFLALNSDAETAQDAIASAPTQARASAYVTGSVDLTDNKLLVGTATSEENGLYVGSNGMLVADAAGSTNVSGTTSFADGSSLHFVNVADGQTVTIGSVGQEATVGTTVDNVLYTVSQDGYTYTFAQRTSEQLNEVGLGDVDSSFLEGLNGQDNPGADYISGFLDESASGVTNGNRGQQIKAAMNLATAAGVQTMAIDGTMMGIEAANKRASIINNFVDGGKLFAELTGKHSEMGGGSSFGEIESDLGGLVVGGEYTANDWTFGALANLGTGSVDGKGDNSGVENDVDYYGIQAYAGKRFGQFNLVGQVGYLMSENDISHSTIGSNTADVDADVWTIGLRGEMRFELSDTARMVPYVGINYLRISTDGYTTSQGVKVDDVDQDLWTTPVGVKFAGDFESNSGWVWSPSLDVAYIPAFGDTDVDAKTDVGVVGHTSMDVWSDSVGRAKLGISAQKDNFGIGLEVGGAAGADDFTEYFGQVRVDYRF